MTSFQRREQLIEVGRSLFATKGFEAVSVEEIASSAKVSKPIVYEHFGGKEGLYAVVVDRAMQSLTVALNASLEESSDHPRRIVERTALALLTFIEEHTEGFQILVRDSPSTDPSSSFSSLLGDVSLKVEEILDESFKRQKLSTRAVPYYAQMLVGLTVFTGQYWADRRKASKEQLAAYIVNLAWNGLSRLESKPVLRFEGKRNKAKEQRKPEHRAAPDTDAQRSDAVDPVEDGHIEEGTTANTDDKAASAEHSTEKDGIGEG